MQHKNINKFTKEILKWYAQNARNLPWRKTKDPFKILVAEFLLQKTDVNKVEPVYKAFIKRWPNPQKLSKAEISSIVKIIHPLGLRYKAKRLKSAAKLITEKFAGKVPKFENELLMLPGVGRYIASAVACFAFNKPVAVLDTNVIRILNRVFGLQSKKNRPRDDVYVWCEAQKLIPKSNAKEYNWGLLDYGALICKNSKPLCYQCQMKNMCLSHKRSNIITDKDRRKGKGKFTAIDLFAGAGGLSLGFEQAGFKIVLAVEKEKDSAETYKINRNGSCAELKISNIADVNFKNFLKINKFKKGEIDILIGGPPCQGFSTSNTKTRSEKNPQNKLFREFLRAVREIRPKWILFENVAGIVEFREGKVVKSLMASLTKQGYTCVWKIVNTAEYGIPQTRRRFILLGNRIGANFKFPAPSCGVGKKPLITVKDAISDLPYLKQGNSIDFVQYRHNSSRLSEYQKLMRKENASNHCSNNLVTKNNDLIIKRYKFIPPGGNWQDIPSRLMKNYKDKNKCHSGIYRRLRWDDPSIVISNFRKNMLIHSSQNRGLSVREAARLQSFPDWYIFCGNLGSQQQQVADAVPPLLSRKIGYEIKKNYNRKQT